MIKLIATDVDGTLVKDGTMTINPEYMTVIRKLTELTTEIAGGNLDIVLETNSNDEIGQLSRAFNSMTTALRETRRSERMRLELPPLRRP